MKNNPNLLGTFNLYRPQWSCEGYVFYRCVSVHRGEGGCVCLVLEGPGPRGVSGPRGVLGPGGAWSQGGCLVWGVPGPVGVGLVSQHALRQTPPPPERQLLLWTVCILLECISCCNYILHCMKTFRHQKLGRMNIVYFQTTSYNCLYNSQSKR